MCEIPDSTYKRFLLKGLISLTGKLEDQKQIQMLRDTGAQSLVVADVLPLSDETFCGSSVLVQGLETEISNVSLHRIHLESELVTGFVRVGVRHSLPIKGVTFVLGNDLAGGKVMPVLEVLDKPDELCGNDELSNTYPDVFPTCVITRAQSQKAGNVVTLSDSFIALIFTPDMHLTVVNDEKQQKVKSLGSHVTADVLRLPVTREQIIALQKEDQTLAKCFATVNSLGETIVKERNAEYAVDA